VLQEKLVRPVGASHEVPVDVRVLAATNRDVEADIAAGRFRQDLYYRLNVIRLELPPLNERSQDLTPLVEHFLRHYSVEMSKEVVGLTGDALRALREYDFPGNVRELENVVERAVALAGSRVIGLGELPREISGSVGSSSTRLLELPEDGCKLDDVMNEVERRFLIEALARSAGVRKAAADLLGITFRSFRYRLDKHALDPSSEPGGGDGTAGVDSE
jgi:two-component system response regulator PilR (NtrC family)